MPLLAFIPEHCILEQELKLATEHQSLGLLKAMETPHELTVLAQLTWAKEHNFWLATRRLPAAPRIFKNLNRLNNYLKKISPTVPVHLLRISVLISHD